MKRIHSIFALILVFTLVFQTTAFATGDSSIEASSVTVTELNGVRTGSAISGTIEYTVVYDTINDTISFTERNLQSGNVSSDTQSISDTTTTLINPRATIDQDTSSGFRYLITTGATYEWHLERPKAKEEGTGRYYFECYENSSNESELELFRDEVSTLASNEVTLRGKTTTAMATSFFTGLLAGFSVASGGILAPLAITTLIATVGLTGDAMVAAEIVAIQCNDCMYAIEDVYWATDNMHF